MSKEKKKETGRVQGMIQMALLDAVRSIYRRCRKRCMLLV